MGGRSGQTLESGGAINNYSKLEIISNFAISNNDKNNYLALSGIPTNETGNVEIKKSIGFGGAEIIEVSFNANGIQMDRSINLTKKTITNEAFYINENSKFKGQGANIFAKQVKEAKKNNFDKIITSAARSESENGYYTWARLGYTPKNEASALKNIESKTGIKYNSFQEMMSLNEGAKIWKTHGSAFTGSFDLRAGSSSNVILNNYLKNRKT